MRPSNLIVRLEMRIVEPSGSARTAVAGLCPPHREPTGEYGCLVWLPDSETDTTIFGADSLQALSLALGFMKQQLNALSAKGWTFFYEGTDDEIPFDAYFPR